MKQAVVFVHGMGEQIPMETITGFVDTMWTKDLALTDAGELDPNTGGKRTANASWVKPDRRTRSFEVRRITTESDKNHRRVDFYEFYWAHLMYGTTWEHVWGWLKGLLLRNPFNRVPPRMLPAWLVLWLITLAGFSVLIWGFLPREDGQIPAWQAVLTGLGGLVASALFANVVIRRFGDVARYVSAKPSNVARRQEIREKGVELLETLIDSRKTRLVDGKRVEVPEYDRIIVVAHSLGTIVAYDMLALLFARRNRDFPAGKRQPKREAMEDMLRAALATGEDAKPFDAAVFRELQGELWIEANNQGARWPISDFITLGSPLTHAEFLMARSKDKLRDQQNARLFPTCPPVLEYDQYTKRRHFTYIPYGTETQPEIPRLPHHAALFAYTRWTNLYSDHWWLIWGDIISGPVGRAFAIFKGGTPVAGIRDIAVLPKYHSGAPANGFRRRLFSHNLYWKDDHWAEKDQPAVPDHIRELRGVLDLTGEHTAWPDLVPFEPETPSAE